MDKTSITIVPSPSGTKILGTRAGDEILRAMIDRPPVSVDHEAATRLLEGLALWLEERLHVVLCVDDPLDTSCTLGLADDFGFGSHNPFFRTDVLERHRAGKGRQLRLGDFGEVRRIARRG